MALGAAGLATPPEQLGRQIFLPGREGTLQIEMLAGARRNGALAIEIPGSLDALLRETAAGQPVVVLLNLGLSWAPSWHYAVVIGYDLDDGAFLLRSGPIERQVLPFETFERTWARGGNWAFVVLPPGKLAASAGETQTTTALVAFEKTAPPLRAATAYRSALERWPGSLTLAMGLGNSLYKAGALPEAETVFKNAARRHDAAAAWNNLANLLLERGRLREARDAAQKAVALGGPTLDTAQDTLRQIEARLAASASPRRKAPATGPPGADGPSAPAGGISPGKARRQAHQLPGPGHRRKIQTVVETAVVVGQAEQQVGPTVPIQVARPSHAGVVSPP
jgi:hypothetical protein